LEECF